ncbi:MAG TPA: hypothetical protein PLL75_01635 [Candidatus Omnitrophota bacterium]|nr:hypothetical protein [Candidatus Omnitrophota bacterium]HPS36416.1 hypothetical protein [Candidatus Omnitrophota bacterium]
MERLKINESGLGLFELIVATTLLAVVGFTATALLLHYNRAFFNFTKDEASLANTVYGAVEEIVHRVAIANRITVNPTNLVAFVDENATPTFSDPADDTAYNYQFVDMTSKYLICTKTRLSDGTQEQRTVATDLQSLVFTLHPGVPNIVTIKLTARARNEEGVKGGPSEVIETTVVARQRSSQ